jgi:spore coat protein SA
MKTAFVIAPEMLPVPPVKGGAVEHWIHEVSQQLGQMGLRVLVASRPAGTAATGSLNVIPIEVAWTAMGRRLAAFKSHCGRRNPLRPLAKIALVLSYALGVRRRLARVRTDILYAHNDPLIAWLVAVGRPEPLVLHMHNDHLSRPALKPVSHLALRRSVRVLCVSAFIAQRVADRFPAHAHKVFAIANATDPSCFGNALFARPRPAAAMTEGEPAPFSILYVGRLTQDKGVHVLIDAFALTLRQFPGARLTIAGSSFFADAPRTAYEVGLAARAATWAHAIEFTGFVPHERLRFLYAQADVVVVPSVWQEPSGLVVLEAMASRTCVVASRVGGIPELIADGQTGLLVPPGDPPALAAALAILLTDPALRARLSASARQAVLERFTYDRLARDVAENLGGLT